MNAVEEFCKDRDEALLSMDKEKILAYAQKYELKSPDEDLSFWCAVHKARTALETLPMFERAASKWWLIKKGMGSWDDGDVLPPMKRADQIRYYERCEQFGID